MNKHLINIKKSLIGGLVLPLLMTACGSKSKTLVITDEPIPQKPTNFLQHKSDFSVAARDTKDGHLHVISYNANSLCSFLNPGDTLEIDFVDNNNKDYYEGGCELVVTDYQTREYESVIEKPEQICNSNGCTPLAYHDIKIYVYLSDKTTQKMVDRRATKVKGLLSVNDSLRNTIDSLKNVINDVTESKLSLER